MAYIRLLAWAVASVVISAVASPSAQPVCGKWSNVLKDVQKVVVNFHKEQPSKVEYFVGSYA